MDDHDTKLKDGGPTWTTPELVQASTARRDDCQSHLVQRVIAALRRGGINCSVVVTREEEPH